MQLITLINLTRQFITDRNWWTFHNPKNDANNILIEASELAELFVQPDSTLQPQAMRAAEIADILSATFGFTIVAQLDLAQVLLKQLGQFTSVTESELPDSQNLTYIELQNLVLKQKIPLQLAQLTTPTATVLSLVYHAGRLADLFHWQPATQSLARVGTQRHLIDPLLVKLIAHLVWLAQLLELDLPVEFQRKMAKNIQKFPVDQAQGPNWMNIKDRLRSGC